MSVFEVDLVGGLVTAELARQVYEHRKRTSYLAPIESQAGTGDPTLARRVAWLQQRVRALPPPARVAAGKRWPQGVPTKSADLTSHAQIDAIAKVLSGVERDHQAPFPEPDPGITKPAAPEISQPEPEPRPDRHQEATDWADRGKAVLATLDDEPLARACAEVAGCADRRMSELNYEALVAVVEQVGAVGGAIKAHWPGPVIKVVPEAEQIMALAAAQATGAETARKSHGLKAARQMAKRHGLPTPKSLAEAAENPLLPALVAASGTPSKTDTKE